MNSAYKPPLLWNCIHNLMDVGLPYRQWASNSTRTVIPEGVPFIQDQQCTICKGWTARTFGA